MRGLMRDLMPLIMLDKGQGVFEIFLTWTAKELVALCLEMGLHGFDAFEVLPRAPRAGK